MFKIKNAQQMIQNLDVFFDTIDEGVLVFRTGVKNYLHTNKEEFNDNLETISRLESKSNELRRNIESELYTHSLMSDTRGDILTLLEQMGSIVNKLKRNLFQFEVEIPYIPIDLNNDFIKLAEISTLSVEGTIPAAKAYFRSPELITEKIHRVYFYENETNKLAQSIKRKVFHDMDALRLSEKFHLRYFALHIEELSHGAEKVADLLSVMAIKRNF